MKKIVLVDRATIIAKHILANEFDKIEIALLVVDTEEQKKSFENQPCVKKVVTVAEIDHYDSVCGLDFQLVRECKDVQLLVENALTRYEADYNEKKYIYYCALAFWNRVFTECAIDAIFVNGVIHGAPYDGLFKAFARKYSIPFFSANNIGVDYWVRCICDEGNNTVKRVFNKVNMKNMNSYLIGEKEDVFNRAFDPSFEITTGDAVTKKFKMRIKKFVYHLGGEMAIMLCSAIFKGSMKHKIASTGFSTTIFKEMKCFFDFLRTQSFLKKHEIEVEPNQKFIFFPLHFEPEGTIQCRLTMESQLCIIKILSETIPADWKIYVKEHPHQFKVNTSLSFYYMHNVNLFKTKQFYKRILQMNNVRIVSHKYSSQELVKESEGVAALYSSVLLETTMEKKPILLFSEKHPFVKDPDVLCCFSYNDCINAIQKIQNGFRPQYSSILQTMNRYVCSSPNDFLDNCIRIIVESNVD